MRSFSAAMLLIAAAHPATLALSAEHVVPAFPGAEGFGATATGGRGGRVLLVDSTADDPRNPAPGTLRWACESQSGARIVVFRTSGIIELAQSIRITHPDLTIAAQTAPGDGICLRGSEITIEASNVIVRGLRSRPGDGKVGTSGQYRHALAINGPVSRVIIDHCSLSWGVDGTFQVYGNKEGKAPGQFTVQWCLMGEGLHHSIHQQGDHSCAIVLGGGTVKDFSFHHNLLAHHNARNPRIVWDAHGELVNNVVYDWGGQATILEPFNPVKVKRDKRRPDEKTLGGMRLNFIGNSWIAGPSSHATRLPIHIKHPTDGTQIYLHDNVGPQRPADTTPGKNELRIADGPGRVFESDAPAIESSGLTVQPSAAAAAAVLRSAGALVPVRDAVDQRIVQQVTDRTGHIIDSPADVGGYPAYREARGLADADQDGMPDDWEKARRLDPRRSNSGGHDLDPDYDNIEVYINGLLSAVHDERASK